MIADLTYQEVYVGYAAHINLRKPEYGYLRMLETEKASIAVDVETISLEDKTIIGIGISNGQGTAYAGTDALWFKDILKIIADNKITKIYHNGRFDIGLIEEQFDVYSWPVEDTMLAANVLGWPGKLAELSQTHFSTRWPSIPELLHHHLSKKKQRQNMLEVPSEETSYKCANDAYYTYKLWHDVLIHIVPSQAYELEMKISPLLTEIEDRGMQIDTSQLERHLQESQLKFDAIKKHIQVNFDIENPGSNKQVGDALIKRDYILKKRARTGNYVLDEKALKQIESPISKSVIAYRKESKLISTYILPIKEKFLDEANRIHGNINHGTVTTGRFSRSEPNLQNIPPSMRDMYIAKENHYLEAWDLDQIELRIIAWYCETYYDDPTMANIFRSGQDIHQATGDFLGISRRDGKTFNFAVSYGAGAKHAAEVLGITVQKATEGQERLAQVYPGIGRFKSDTIQILLSHGYAETRMGRRRRFDRELSSRRQYLVEAAKREAFNARIQGTAGEDLKRLMVRARHYPQINTIHDEILFEVPDNTTLEATANINLAPYETPMTVKRGQNWASMQEISPP